MRRLFKELEGVCAALGGDFREYVDRAVCVFHKGKTHNRLVVYETGFLEFIRQLPPEGKQRDVIDIDNVTEIRESPDGAEVVIESSEGLLTYDKKTGTMHIKLY